MSTVHVEEGGVGNEVKGKLFSGDGGGLLASGSGIALNETKRAENMKIILCSTYRGLALISTFCESSPTQQQHQQTISEWGHLLVFAIAG